MTTVRLALGCGITSAKAMARSGYADETPPEPLPSVLIAYPMAKRLDEILGMFKWREWVLDSGAFSAHSIGLKIDIDQFIEFCREQLAGPRPPKEIFGLDVIGDWRAGLRNVERMWKAGVPAIPAYHYGEPGDVLLGIARDYPKIAIGGCARMKGSARREFVRYCFGKVWPKPIHGFGLTSDELCMSFPFHSVDSTTWEYAMSMALRSDVYQMPKQRRFLKGHTYSLSADIERWLGLEAKYQGRWAKEMEMLNTTLREWAGSNR